MGRSYESTIDPEEVKTRIEAAVRTFLGNRILTGQEIGRSVISQREEVDREREKDLVQRVVVDKDRKELIR